jgi:N-acetyl sugar amidotransferase
MSDRNPEVRFCTRCVISTLRPITTVEAKHQRNEKKPTTRLDESGVCDACRWAQIKETEIDWVQREKELVELCDRYRSNNGEWDVVVPASGGKDSIYVSHLLKSKYGMHPLTVTWAPHLWTETGVRNHQNLIKSGFDNILVSPNGKVHRLLTRLAFVNLGHPFQPFIFGQRTVGPRIALNYGVKLVFYGENVAEYGNRIEDNYIPTMDPILYTCYDIDDPKTVLAGVSVDDLKKKYNLTRSDLLLYKSPSLQEIDEANLKVHYMSYYRKWVPQENYYYAMKHSAFEPSPTRTSGSYSKYSGLDDKLEWFHYYMMYIKFGMGRATADAAQEIRSGKITREEGIALVRKYDGEFPQQHLSDVLEYTGLTENELFAAIDSFRSSTLWEKRDGVWILKHRI